MTWMPNWLCSSFASSVLTPSLLRAGPALITALARLPVLGRHVADPVEADMAAATSSGHALICGYGRVGRELVDRASEYAAHNSWESRKTEYLGLIDSLCHGKA